MDAELTSERRRLPLDDPARSNGDATPMRTLLRNGETAGKIDLPGGWRIRSKRLSPAVRETEGGVLRFDAWLRLVGDQGDARIDIAARLLTGLGELHDRFHA